MPGDVQSWPPLLQRLATLRYRVRRADPRAVHGCELFLADLSEWKLRLSDQTPVLWVRTDPDQERPQPPDLDVLVDITREQGWRHLDCLVLLDGDGRGIKLDAARIYFPRFIVLDGADQENILRAPSATGALLDLICDQVPLSSLAPYEISRPVTGSGFFGREREVDQILRQNKSNFAIIGVRRIGKTSLLTEVRRRLVASGLGAGSVFIDCSNLSSPDEFVQEVVRQLYPHELRRLSRAEKIPFFFPDFLRRMTHMYEGHVTLFLDEFDSMLDWGKAAQVLLATLRGVMKDGPEIVRELARHAPQAECRLVVAGFRRLMIELHHSESPFLLAFAPIGVGPFTLQDTEQAIGLPFRSLRIRFEDERRVVTTIHNETHGHPLLVQYYCREIVNLLAQRGSRIVSPGLLPELHRRDSFRAYLLSGFRTSLEPREKALVYAILLKWLDTREVYRLEDVHRAYRECGMPGNVEDVDAMCDNLVWAGVFEREGEEYRFALPILPRLLSANHNLRYRLEEIRQETR